VALRPEDLMKRALKGAVARLRDRFDPGPPTATGPVQVVFEGRGEGPVEPGSTLLVAAAALGVDLNHYCGGTCSCGTCRLEIVEGGRNLSRPEGREKMVLGAVYTERGHRLGCQAKVFGPIRVRIPTWF